MFGRIVLVLVVGFLGWAFQAMTPPPPKVCGTPNGPPVISPRIRLRDGRYLAYKETGAPKESAKYKIILAHGFRSSKEFRIPVSPELGIYFLSFDRAGYGESDPNPKRTVKSEAMDIEEMADQLEMGPKFYVIGMSMGGYTAWSCLKYIPHRLAGVALIAPVINRWWPSFPANLSRNAYEQQLVQDRWTLRIAHYAPSFLYWWMTQKWFPSLSITQGSPDIFSQQDKEIFQKMIATGAHFEDHTRQQGDYESLHRDMMVGFGKWEFDPMDLSNPFPNNEGSVHLWQGHEDRLVPFELQRYVSKKLPWIKYHEIPNGGHLFVFADGVGDIILRELLLGEEPTNLST
ncbi:putative lysophospholipase BODYGUARD 1 [Tasmannia lanceolata]|uniref:putative lysophospholipase BODYGUARD 1 n=1 Tax=Tasmannia lanceolata TaxID=3420 RepID=UPI004064265D